ncbi:MAG: hypothetical protein JXD21_07095 [Candidatus Omnitrophica bacterium]|nr:hypothetical protein [Candidatus Omnitrophota bacterium]
MSVVPKILVGLGIVLISVTGIIHVIDAPDALEEAAYKGWLFYANGVGSLIAAIGILCGKRWGWNLGLVITALTIVGYILSRTVGLPYIPAEPDEWLEPLGIISLVAEGLFVSLFFKITALHKKVS